MENIDSDIEFSDGSSDENDDFDSEDDSALAEISKWSEHLQPVQTMDFNGLHPGPSTPMEKKKRRSIFFICSQKDYIRTYQLIRTCMQWRALLTNPKIKILIITLTWI